MKNVCRVLHVLGGMNCGGIETWLMNVFRQIDRERFQFDFLVHTETPCFYDDEIRSLGGTIIPCLSPSHPWCYARNFGRIMMEYGPYDVVHSHVHHYSGFVLRQARKAGVPIRIAHSHNDTLLLNSKEGVLRRTYLRFMERLINYYATDGLACSQKAARSLFGAKWDNDPRWKISFCGINLQPFKAQVNPAEVRAELGIPEDAFVVGHVGRFAEQKNHTFLVDIAECLAKNDSQVRILLVGDGPLRPNIEAKVARLGLTEHVIFAGLRADVPRLMLGAMDTFFLPSVYEGLGLVLVEAQAAGLPCFFSDVVPIEADVVVSLIHRLSLEQPACVWADAILNYKRCHLIKRSEALRIVSQSPFDITYSMQRLCKIYCGL
jgi:glycosyltransferase involved in cell wall biosynthesis